MKILLETPLGKATGGIARWSEHILAYYKEKGLASCEMDILPMGRVDSVGRPKGLLCRSWTGLRDYWKFITLQSQMMAKKRYDVVHLVSSASISLLKDLLMLFLARSKGARTVVHFRFGRVPELAVKKNWEWWLLCCVVALSDIAIFIDKNSYSALLNAGFKNIRLLPNPIAPRVMKIATQKGGVERVKREILFVGHGLRTKGTYDLIDACREIPGIRVKMIGAIAEDEKNALWEYANRALWLDIQGERPYEKVIEEMCRCDLFVLPSHTEGFPNVILESMACGCAIVTTAVGAIPEMLEEEEAQPFGEVVEPKNVMQLKCAIEKMLRDSDYKEKCRYNVKKRVATRYNMDAVWCQMVNIWNSLL